MPYDTLYPSVIGFAKMYTYARKFYITLKRFNKGVSVLKQLAPRMKQVEWMNHFKPKV